jgi:hypothetical protein
MRAACSAALALLLAASPARAAGTADHEVRLHLKLSRSPHGTAAERARLRELEEEVMHRLERASAGRLVRDAWPAGECVITLAGPDAHATWAAVADAVRAHGPRPGSYAALRRGPPGAREERIDLTSGATTPR